MMEIDHFSIWDTTTYITAQSSLWWNTLKVLPFGKGITKTWYRCWLQQKSKLMTDLLCKGKNDINRGTISVDLLNDLYETHLSDRKRYILSLPSLRLIQTFNLVEKIINLVYPTNNEDQSRTKLIVISYQIKTLVKHACGQAGIKTCKRNALFYVSNEMLISIGQYRITSYL